MLSPKALVSMVAAPVTLLAMVLLPAGSAQASAGARPAAATSGPAGLRPPASHRPAQAVPPTPARATARAKPASPAKAATPAKAGTPDARQVCATPKRGHAACMSLLRTNVKAHKGLFAADTAPPGYGPSDLQSAYNLPSATAGSGATVAIVDAYDDPDAEADLQTYRAQYGLPLCDTANGCFQKVNQEGQASPLPPAAGSNGWDVEESLDIDMVSAVCPNCHIILVEADSNDNSDLYAAEDEAVALGAEYVSNSWGESEYTGEAQDDQYFNHPGVVITAAGGDNGYLDQGEGDDTPNWPAASQYVTSVGGTTLTRDASTARGWTETAWGSSSGGDGTGSGCSVSESKPAWQTDTGCANRMTNDVSAVADPSTGVAVYDSYSEDGWLVVGGTSVATPVIASSYALAGAPEAGTYPSSYPYLNGSGLNDVTSGANGTCTPAYFCTAGPGYDGPTGLGTPDGVAAFTPVTYGTLSGTVTDSVTGKPISGATVTAGAFSATTGSSGQYSFAAATGSYTVTAQAFGYAQQSATGVQVTTGQASTLDFALTTAPDVTVSGTVTDASGQGWPLFAKITIAGDPDGPVYTDPFTGAYSVNLPGQASYTLTVTPVYPGYTAKTVAVTVGTTGVQQNAAVSINASECDAPGYASSGGTCGPVTGGLVAGVVTDANTGTPVNGATVASTAAPSQAGTSRATADPALPGGFYWLFATPAGSTTFTASSTGYQTASASVDVASGGVTRQDWTLQAGQLSITPASVSAAGPLGQSVTKKVTFTNTGGVAVHVTLGTQAGTFTPAGQPAGQDRSASASLQEIRGHFTPGSVTAPNAGRQTVTLRRAVGSSAAPWSRIADYPIPISANAAAYDPQNGEIYSVGGYSDGSYTAKGYAYTPATGTWSAIPSAPRALLSPAAAFVDGVLYLIGGQDHGGSGTPSAAVYAFTPGSGRWSRVGRLPKAVAGPMAAVLGGQLYVVGGCTDLNCDQRTSDAVYRYDPGSNTWAKLASYPIPVGYGACAGIDGEVVCTGGIEDRYSSSSDLSATYIYDPATNTWSQGASIPSVEGTGYWGMAYAGANGELQIADGATDGDTVATNEAQEYDPVTNTWSQLPPTTYAGYQGAGACGFYQIGGGGPSAGPVAQVLAGYDQCGGAGDASWLSVKDSTGFTVPAGQAVTVSVRLDSAKLDQPGTYTATLWAATDTPYPVQLIPVTMQVSPPSGWQEISGTVTGTGGAQLDGVTITFSRPGGGSGAGQGAGATQTDADGSYLWWMSGGTGRVQVSAAKDAYQPQARMVTLTAGRKASVSFALKPDPATSPYHPAAAGPGSADASIAPSTGTASGSAAAHQASGTAARSAAAGKTAAALTDAGAAVRACPAPRPGYAACLSLVRTNVPRHKGLFTADAGPSGYGPTDLRSAYSLPSAKAGSGATVAIVDAYDDPAAEADLAIYRQQYGLPACTTANGCFKKVNQEGQQGSYPPANASWAEEESLDVDMVSAICPSCHILLVEANSNAITSLGRSVDEAVKLGATYVSNSYGTNETAAETRDNKYWDHPGVAVTVAAGDGGYGVEFPAASPDVTAVGGTTLTRDTDVPRGWTESAWSTSSTEGTGSGCSAYEPKPVWQRDTGCANRTVVDVSADADPATGVAVYDSGDGGWEEFGGTSVASPIIASAYALAGAPKKGTYPASYPYLHATGLNDVTTGATATCVPAYLCAAGPGYDGPTGLGTPAGISAFKPVTYGTITGTITSTATGKPVAGAAVTAGGLTATAGSTGGYTLTVPPGSYDLTASYYGYALATASGVQVAKGQTAMQDLTLKKAAKVTVSGAVTDGSGHGWPLYAKITIGGVPGSPAPAYTSPSTGNYRIRLPGQNTYTLTVTPDYPGYTASTVTITAGTASVRRNITIPVAELACQQAPGYTFSRDGGVYEGFTGWPASGTTQDGWTVTNGNSSSGWVFGNPPPPLLGLGDWTGNPTGGSGGFAVATPLEHGGAAQDTSLVSPVFDLSGIASPDITFDTAEVSAAQTSDFDASVDISLDGGTTWQSVWQQAGTDFLQEDLAVSIPVPQAAGQPDVQIRFHYTGTLLSYWALDDIQVGTPACAPVRGGLVAGVVTDANTGQPVNGATVTSHAAAGGSGSTVATGDPAMPGGFYWLFSAHTGTTKLTVTRTGYQPARDTADIGASAVTQQEWVLKAGQLTADASSLSATEALGHSKMARVTFRNGGTAPVRVQFGDQAGDFTPLTQPAGQAPGDAPRQAMANGAPARLAASGSGWTGIASYPNTIVNNAAAYDPQTGQVYSVGGQDNGGEPGQVTGAGTGYGYTASAYVYDPQANAWKPIAPAPQPLESPAAAFLDGTLYLIGGFDLDAEPSAAVYAYTPGSGTWTQVTDLPVAVAGASATVLDSQLYVIGGCTASPCSTADSQAVYRYDPGSNTWTKRASYPVDGGVSFEACAGVEGEIACAGGLSIGINNVLNSTYIYNPVSNTWTQGADMPYADYQMPYSGSDGQLQIAGGVTFSSYTKRVSQYDPASNTWSALPSLPSAEWGGGGSCGMYVVGGESGSGTDLASAQVLPGYGQCDGAGDTGWLPAPRGFTLQPGQSVTIKVVLDAGQVDQPGTYTADLWAATNTPYPVTVIPVTLTVKPPSGWGLLTGTVTTSGGKPLAGATVQIDTTCTAGDHCGKLSYTLTTGADGSYQWWLPAADNGLQVILADDGYIQQVTHAGISGGKTLTLSYALQNYQPSMR